MHNRRAFFRNFVGQLIVAFEEVKGHRHFKLSDLAKLDEEQFRRLILRIREEIIIRSDSTGTSAILNEGELILCAPDTREEIMFLHIQHRSTMEEIIQAVEKIEELPMEDGYTVVRAYTLNLVNQGVCIPANEVHFQEEEE